MSRLRSFLIISVTTVTLAAAAQAGDDVRALEKRFREVAARAIPATVLVKSTLSDGSGRSGFGSGALISADGHILTCSHVVDIAGEVEVTLSTGETMAARMLGKNPKQDYALLKIEAEDLPFFKLGDSTRLALGEWVIALGHPGGPYPDLKPSFSVGRITGLHRRLPVQMMDRYYDDAIRTDAPIFAGNSGGPLLSLDGDLVGINGAILLVNENSYAVPIHEIAANLDRLKKGEQMAGRKAEGLGAPIDEFEGKDLAKFIGRAGRRLLGREGLGKLIPGEGPESDQIARALERIGRSLEGERAQKTLEQLFETFGGEGRPDGGGRRPELPDLGDLPDFSELRDQVERLRERFLGGGKPEPVAPPPPAAYLGLVPVTGAEAREVAGVEVSEVLAGSPAQAAGVRTGDVIVKVGNTAVDDPGDLVYALRQHRPGETVRMRLLRPKITAGVRLEEPWELSATLAKRDGEGR
jgi:serine protease Do